jgi:hypothetical protein
MRLTHDYTHCCNPAVRGKHGAAAMTLAGGVPLIGVISFRSFWDDSHIFSQIRSETYPLISSAKRRVDSRPFRIGGFSIYVQRLISENACKSSGSDRA